jgi:hypothetical protein
MADLLRDPARLVPPPLEGLTSEVLAAIDERLASGDLRAV